MNLLDIDAGRGPGYKDEVPGAHVPVQPGERRSHPLEESLESEEKQYLPLVDPGTLKQGLPAGDDVRRVVSDARKTIRNILMKADPRLLVITGPCSIHDERAALDYARRLARLQARVSESMFLVMRAYFEKPRTATGWKGLINDPHLNGTCNLAEGLRRARRILLGINAMGVPAATEMLEPTTPTYIADLISWTAIGARTTESQTHREMASGLPMPVGFKNSTDGSLAAALNAIRAAGSPQTFTSIDQQGRTGIVRTTGNPWGHVVLRGGESPNYHAEDVEDIRRLLREQGFSEVLMVDCSHGNSRKDHRRQPGVCRSVVRQRLDGDDAIVGLMLESNLREGRQPLGSDPSALAYGVSITDACMGWDETENLLLETHARLMNNPGFRERNARNLSAADARPVTSQRM